MEGRKDVKNNGKEGRMEKKINTAKFGVILTHTKDKKKSGKC